MSVLVSYLVCWALLSVGTVVSRRMKISDCASQKLELVFVQDASFSVSESSFKMAKTFITDTIRQLPIGPDRIRVALVRYGTEADVIAELADSSNVTTVTDALDRMEYKIGGTDTALALRVVRNQVLNEARQDARSVVVVITDGASNNPRKTRWNAEKLRDDGVRLVWLYIMLEGQGSLGRERKSMDREGDKTFQVNRFDDLGEETIWQILDASCKEPEPAKPVEEITTTAEEITTTAEETTTTAEETTTTAEETTTTTEEMTTTAEEATTTAEEITTTAEEATTTAEESTTMADESTISTGKSITTNSDTPTETTAGTDAGATSAAELPENPRESTTTTTSRARAARPQDDSSPQSAADNATDAPAKSQMTSSTAAAEHEEMSSVPREEDQGEMGEVEGDGSWKNSWPKVIGTVVGVVTAIALTSCLVLLALRRRNEKRRMKAKQEP